MNSCYEQSPICSNVICGIFVYYNMASQLSSQVKIVFCKILVLLVSLYSTGAMCYKQGWITWYGMNELLKLPQLYVLFGVHCYFNNTL